MCEIENAPFVSRNRRQRKNENHVVDVVTTWKPGVVMETDKLTNRQTKTNRLPRFIVKEEGGCTTIDLLAVHFCCCTKRAMHRRKMHRVECAVHVLMSY